MPVRRDWVRADVGTETHSREQTLRPTKFFCDFPHEICISVMTLFMQVFPWQFLNGARRAVPPELSKISTLHCKMSRCALERVCQLLSPST